MLRHTSEIKGYGIAARDGPIGSVCDYLFDDQAWRVRWVVVDTGALLPGKKVLIAPMVLGDIDSGESRFRVRLTVDQVKHSPGVDTDAPVSRQMEGDVYDYYGWSPYWTSGLFMGGYAYAGGTMGAPLAMDLARPGHGDADGQKPEGDPHLRSVNEVRGYHIHATDGEIGHVSDVVIEDEDWSLRYLVVDTQNWWPGRKVLIAPRLVETVDWATRRVTLSVDRQTVQDSPAYDPSVTIDRAYENRFHDYFTRQPKPEPVD